jgi:hypothetical protein
MKHIKTYEDKLRFKNFKDMENWNPKEEDTIKYTGKKTLDLSVGQRVIDFFEANDLFISVGTGEWIKKQDLLLPDEKDFKEYRVNIGTKQSFQDWIEWEYGDKPEDKTDEELEKEYDNVEIDYEDSKPEWSVFLPVSIKGEFEIKKAAMADSSIYLKIITDAFPDISRNYIDSRRGALYDDPKGFKKFINNKNVKITNQNIEMVTTIDTRLWKDSKVFGCFRSEIFDGEWETKTFIEEWLKLIK